MGLFDIPSVDIGFSLPKECENAIVEVMSDSAMGVAESVLGDDAFKNPFEGGIDGVADMLNGSAGIMGKIDGLLSDDNLLPDQEQMLNDLKTQFGGEDGLGGMIGQMAELKQHTNMMSGVGDLGAFTERLGMAGSLDGAMQRLGQGEGGFGNLFKSFENVGGMVDNLKGSLGPLNDMLDGGIDGLDTGLLGSMKDNLGKMGDDLIGEVNADNLAFGAASALVEKLGVADMISTNNCYIKDLMGGAIGTPKLMENLPASVEEKFGPELKPEELAAVKQVEEISIEESKKAGVHSPALAGMAGSNVVKSVEKKKEVAGRPVFDKININRRNLKNFSPAESMIFNSLGRLEGSPHWEENLKGADGKDGVWIQWWSHFLGSREVLATEEDIVAEKNALIVQIFMWNTKLNTWTSKKINKDTWISGSAAQPMGRNGYELRKRLWKRPQDEHGVELADGYIIRGILTKFDEWDDEVKLFNPVL